MHMVRYVQCLRPAVRRVVVTVRVIHLGHPQFFACSFLLKERVCKIFELSSIGMCSQNVHVGECLRIIQDRVRHVFQILERFRCHDLSILNGTGILLHETKHLLRCPPGPVMGIIRLILYRDGIQVYAIIFHISDKVVQMLRVRGIFVVFQSFGVRIPIVIKGFDHVAWRIPR
ncbi:hypothetical protein D1872_252900 [compost metagenome]